jgi:hypothetical protein
LAYFPDVFGPVLRTEIARAGHLTFDVINRVREQIAPDASLLSAMYACVNQCLEPVVFLTAKLGYKKSEQRQLGDLLSGLDDADQPGPKLRVSSTSPNDAAGLTGIRFHQNMQVPTTSLVSAAYDGTLYRAYGYESLEIWQTSSGGPIGRGRLGVEAIRRGDEVWCLLRLSDSHRARPA